LKTYSIVRIGDAYVVQAGAQSIMKVASRRQAVGLVAEAAQLLGSHPAAGSSRQARAGRSIACDASEVS
jgi:hypothetical protein